MPSLAQIRYLDNSVTKGFERNETGVLHVLQNNLKTRIRRTGGDRSANLRCGDQGACVKSLALLVFGIAVASHIYLSSSADNLAFVAHALHRGAYLHGWSTNEYHQ